MAKVFARHWALGLLACAFSAAAPACSCPLNQATRESTLVAMALLEPELYAVEVLSAAGDPNKSIHGEAIVRESIRGALQVSTVLPHRTDTRCCLCGRVVQPGEREWRTDRRPALGFSVCTPLFGVRQDDAALARRARTIDLPLAPEWRAALRRPLPAEAMALDTEPPAWWWLEDVRSVDRLPAPGCGSEAAFPAGARRARLWVASAASDPSARPAIVDALLVEAADGGDTVVLAPGMQPRSTWSARELQIDALDACGLAIAVRLHPDESGAAPGWRPQTQLLIEPDAAAFYRARWVWWDAALANDTGTHTLSEIAGQSVLLPREPDDESPGQDAP